jgi:serine/threonine protein kinase
MDFDDDDQGISRQDFLKILEASKLLSGPDLESAKSTDAMGEGKSLANALVKAGVITHYQATELLNQRTDRLRIGNYDLLDKLGTGGTGTVFKARHRRLKRDVALKVLSKNLCKDNSFVARFQREVETIAQFQHPNITMAFDADESKMGHFLVMEFVNGPDLASIVQKKGRMPVLEAIDCILQAARGLSFIHQKKMVHRDIKPANLLRDTSNTVKVTDLGLARTAAGAGTSNALTQAGGVLGTVDYMPPEQALDATNLDPRADIYSLGGTLYFLLVGQPPYPGQTMMETMLKHRDAPIPSICAVRSDVPAELDAICRRMMGKTVQERFQSMAEVVKALETLQTRLAPATASSVTTVTSGDDTQSIPPPAPTPKRDTITAPVATPESPTLAAGESVNAALNILVVEPSRTQAGIVRKYLQSQHINKIKVLGSGQEALNAARTEPFNAIVSTMYLSDINGIQLARQVRSDKDCGEPGFVLISSQAESDKLGALTTCASAITLSKPFTPEQLMEALSVVTRKKLEVVPTNVEQMGVTISKPIMVAPLPAAPKFSRLRALLVDGDKGSLGHLRGVLANLGVTQCVEATDGAQAVALLARETYDLIVTEHSLPLMDGPALINYIKQNPTLANIPIIVETAEKSAEKLQTVRAMGVSAVVEKDFPPDAIRKVLEQIAK